MSSTDIAHDHFSCSALLEIMRLNPSRLFPTLSLSSVCKDCFVCVVPWNKIH